MDKVCIFCKTPLQDDVCPNGECVLGQGKINQASLDEEAVRQFLSTREQAEVLSSSQAAMEILGSIAHAQNGMTEMINNLSRSLQLGFQTFGMETRIIAHSLIKKGLLTKEDLDEAEQQLVEELKQIEVARSKVENASTN